MDESEVDYVVCANCETPCYTFDLDPRTRQITSAYCPVCGNDEVKEFRIPEEDEAEE